MIIVIVAVIVAVCLVAGYIFIIQPKQKLSQAENLISRGKYGEAEVLLAQVADSEAKEELLVKITINEIDEALAAGDYATANKKIQSIPEEYVSDEMRITLSMQQAISLMEIGNYSEADTLLSAVTQTEEVTTLREELSYESRVFSCIKAIKKVLKNPDSLSIYEIEFHYKSIKDEEASTEDNPVYVDEAEPSCIMHYGAQNGFGGNTTSYALFKMGDNNEYEFYGSVDSLDADDLDTDDDDWIYDMLVQLEINTIKINNEVGSVNMDRIQKLLKNNSYSYVKIIK